jgi:hypothetical protein
MSDQLPRTSSNQQHPDAFSEGRPDALLSARSRATRTGLKLRDGLPFESWRRLGAQVGALADASAWWIGDWLIFGQRAYPDRYKTAVSVSGLSYQTLRNYAWVASQFPVYRRRDRVSFGHHAEVASLPAADQDMWLLRSISNGWSRNELRSRLRGASVPVADRTPVAIALQVEELRHERWQAAAVAFGRPLSAWITEVLDEAAAAALGSSVKERPMS